MQKWQNVYFRSNVCNDQWAMQIFYETIEIVMI